MTTTFNPITGIWFDDSLVHQWDTVEYHPCKNVSSNDKLDTDSVEQCQAGEADFWSVYLHDVKGGIYCVADVATEKQAQQLARLIELAAKLYLGER